MGNDLILAERQRVEKASLGEVLLFSDMKDIERRVKHIAPLGHEQPDNVIFNGALGIYDGFCKMGMIVRDGDKPVSVELNRKHNYQLTFVEKDGLTIPFIDTPIIANCMVIREDVYIGPEEISAFLKEKCGGHFDRFFADYVKAHREVKD